MRYGDIQRQHAEIRQLVAGLRPDEQVLIRNAEVARGKAAGLYIEQKISLTGKIEDLSIEDLEAKMKKIYNDNKVLIEGDYTVAEDK